MIRLSSLFWLALVLISGFAMFKVKYAVQDLDDELGRVRKQTVAEQQEIRVLNAEWSYLTQPERLAELNRKFLSLAPIPTKQLQQSIDGIPLRPPAPPALPAEEPAIAAAAPSAAPAPDTVAAATGPATPEPAASRATSMAELVAAALQSGAETDEPAAGDTVAPGSARPVPARVATLKPETGLRLVKASATGRPHTLDDLFAQVGGDR